MDSALPFDQRVERINLIQRTLSQLTLTMISLHRHVIDDVAQSPKPMPG